MATKSKDYFREMIRMSPEYGEGRLTDDGRRPATYSLVSSSPVHTRGDDSDDTTFLSVERATEALRNGNVPRMAFENYRKGVQDFKSVVKSVLVFWNKDTSRWQDAAESVLAAVEDLVEEAGV